MHTSNTRLSAAAPHTLEVAVPLGEPVHAVVALAHRAHETAQGVGLVLAGVAAVLVNVADGDLGGGVVGGLDDAVRRGALAGDVTFRRDRLSVCAFPSCLLAMGGDSLARRWMAMRSRGGSGQSYRSTSSPRSFSILTGVSSVTGRG